jgi:hypothetical protein
MLSHAALDFQSQVSGNQDTFFHRTSLVRLSELLMTSFQDDFFHSFSMFVVENSGPLQPLTCDDLRLILTEGGIIQRLDAHDVTNYHTLPLSDLPDIRYLLPLSHSGLWPQL